MNFSEIVNKRYAVKSFDGKIVEDAKIKEILEFIRMAPSSFNIQPWKIKIITDKNNKQKLLPLAWNQPQLTTCSHLLIFCADTNLSHLIDKLEKHMISAGAEPEAIASYLKMMRDFANSLSEEKRLSWAQKQVYIALSNALNGTKAVGLDSCPMEGFDPAGFAKVLDLPKNLVPTVLCPIGYANDEPKPKLRFSQSDIFF